MSNGHGERIKSPVRRGLSQEPDSTTRKARGNDPFTRLTKQAAASERAARHRESCASRLGQKHVEAVDRRELKPSAPRVAPSAPHKLAIRDMWNQPLVARPTKGYGPYYFTSVAQRSQFYLSVQERYGNRRGSHWFEAAGLVTSADGVGSVDRMNLWYWTDPTEKFLRTGNEYLSRSNVEVFADAFARGVDVPGAEGLKGRALDHQMVVIEQTHIQKFMEEYFARVGPKERAVILKDINSNFTPQTFWQRATHLDPANTRHKLAQDYAMREFARRGRTFDFAKIEDRILLGQRMVDSLRGDQ